VVARLRAGRTENSISYLCREQETFPLSYLSGPGLELIKFPSNKYKDSFSGVKEP
jgi:hypothetical protein